MNKHRQSIQGMTDPCDEPSEVYRRGRVIDAVKHYHREVQRAADELDKNLEFLLGAAIRVGDNGCGSLSRINDPTPLPFRERLSRWLAENPK